MVSNNKQSSNSQGLFELVIAALEKDGHQPKPASEGNWLASCPFHEDKDRDFSLHPQKGFNCFHCGKHGSVYEIAEHFGIATKEPFSLKKLAEARGFTPEYLKSLGWSDTKKKGKPVISIPYLDETGELEAVRYHHSISGDFRFSWRKGDHVLPYGLARLNQARKLGYVILVEGESDCARLWREGFPALGIPGATNWKDEWARYLGGITGIFAWQELDDGGKKFVGSITRSVKDIGVITSVDPCDLYLAAPGDFKNQLTELMQKAEPPSKHPTFDHTLLHELHLLRRIVEEVRNQGVVGEERLVATISLMLVSSATERPLNGAIISPPASGKTYTLHCTLDLFPSSTYVLRSGMSEKSYVFSDENLVHRYLVLEELKGYATSETGKALLHSLLWGNRVSYEVTVKDRDGGYTTHKVNKEGPTGFITTAISLRGLDAQDISRMFVVSTQAGDKDIQAVKEQTRAVLFSIADRMNGQQPSGLYAKEAWQAVLTKLTEPAAVDTPWGRWLAQKVGRNIMGFQVHRSFELFMRFVQASTLLHRNSRKVVDGKIVADARDYANARVLIGDEFRATQVEGISGGARRIARWVTDNYEGDEGFTVRQIAEGLNITKQAVHRHIRFLISEGYLINVDEEPHIKVKPGAPLPEEAPPLPEPEELVDAYPGMGGQWVNPVTGEEKCLGEERGVNPQITRCKSSQKAVDGVDDKAGSASERGVDDFVDGSLQVDDSSRPINLPDVDEFESDFEAKHKNCQHVNTKNDKIVPPFFDNKAGLASKVIPDPREVVLGMPVSRALEIWRAASAPEIETEDGKLWT